MNYLKKYFAVALLFLFFIPIEACSEQTSFEVKGIYLEGCNCNMACTCDLEGAMVKGCQLIGAMIISSGTYAGSKLSDVKIAFAIGDNWVRIYVHSKDSAQNKIAGELGRKFLSAYGTVEKIISAEIKIFGSNGNYTLKVDGEKVINLQTQPVLGADEKTAVTYTNYPDPLFQTIMQGKVVSGSYEDGEHHFTLKGTNSFFNQDWVLSGKM